MAILKEKNPYQSRINHIRKAILLEEKRVRQTHGWLHHQNSIGLAIFLSSTTGMAVCAALYIYGHIGLATLFVVQALLSSLLHELEHDLIHDLYFKQLPVVQHVMFAVIWLAKLNANPWWRKTYHLKHHKHSGQVADVEERLIGLGMPMGLKRLLVMLTPLATPLVIFDVAKDSRGVHPELDVLNAYLVNAPGFLPPHLILAVLFFPAYVSAFWYNVCWNITMCLFLPNILRQFSLQVVSTGCHYYGDIPELNVYFQNQVLNHWIFYPFQLFCFNFGATHILHHYITKQPFYLRQMVAFGVYDEFKRQGVRFNDLIIYSRANRFFEDQQNTKQQQIAA